MTSTAPQTLAPDDLDGMLRDMATKLMTSLEADIQSLELKSAGLNDLIREAETAQHRRTRYSARDRACYRLGAAFEPSDGLGLDALTMTGLNCLGRHGLALLIDIAINNPKAQSLSELLAQLFACPHAPLLRAWGAYARWRWAHELYVAETQSFLASQAGRDPNAAWRRGSATAKQTYLIGEIARALAIVAPRSLLRGQAFDWIEAHGGNPRWQTPPPMPALPSLNAVRRGAPDVD